MARITSVDVTAGIPTAGTGTVATLDGVFDATNGPVTTKAASTAPVTATDKAMVTVLRPDSPGIITTGTAGSASSVVLSVQGVASMTKLLVTPDSVALPANQSVNVSQINAVTPLMGNGVTGTGSQRVTIASDNTAFSVNSTNFPTTSGGLTVSSILIASGTNAQNVKASAGQLYKIEVTNNSANIGYLKLYNTAGTPTAGSGTPVIRLMCPGSASGAGSFSSFADLGVAFATGIGLTFTGGIADADTTSVAASAFIVNLYYK